MNNLYILEPIKDWSPWYDRCYGFVISAQSEEEARNLVVVSKGKIGDEGRGVWLDAKLTSCKELTKQTPRGVIMNDFRAA